MGKKIAIVCGSPRKQGNTNRVAAWVADAAREAGADVELIDAVGLDYGTNGCTACMACQQSDEYRCVIDDELSPILARLPDAHVVVFASPVYWHGPTAQLKLFMDRMFSLVKVGATPFTTAFDETAFALIATSGGGMEHGLGLLEETFKLAAGLMQVPFDSLLVPFAPQNPDEIEDKAELKEKAAAFGRRLAGA